MSTSHKQFISDALFVTQIICAFIMGGTQFFRLIVTTQGQLLAMFVTMEAYLFLHLALALNAHRALPSRVTRQSIAIYATWLVVLTADLFAFFVHSPVPWFDNDTRLIQLVLLGVVVLGAYVAVARVPMFDPMIKSVLAMLCKSLPQFLVVYEVWLKGGAGIPGIAVVVGNITIIIRIAQVSVSVYEAGWERNRVWLLASEVMNDLSWAAVSVVWLIRTV